jgi:peptide-methionine (S)-S-oxide reductase
MTVRIAFRDAPLARSGFKDFKTMPTLHRLPAPSKSWLPRVVAVAGATAIAAMVLGGGALAGGAPPVKAPPPAYDPPVTGHVLQTAVLAGGCFWGLQGVYEHVRGVKQVLAGYSGGSAATAHYEMVGTETTGHAETVKITYDPAQISYGEILRIYFSVATDPTQLNKQFPDQGSSYRGDIFYMSPEQKTIAARYIAQLTAAHIYHRPIVTRLDTYPGFYKAEAYHQNYLVDHPDAGYIAAYDMPKVAALKTLLPADYRAKPVIVGPAAV